MPEKSPSPPSPIRTRLKNKNAHPGAIVQAPPRRSSAEVQQERAAKIRAKAAQEAERQQNIQRAAAFEHADMINEDIVDATPCPASFTPTTRPPPRRKKAALAPIAEAGDDPNDSHNSLSSLSPQSPPCSEDSATEEEPASESDSDSQPAIPAKKLKAQKTGKATTKMGRAPPAQKNSKAAIRATQDLDEEFVLASDEEPPRKPKRAKVKARVRDEIDLVANKMKEDKIRNDGGNLAKPTSGQQAGEKQSGRPAPEIPSQVQQRKPLKRAGAIADINESCSEREAKRTKCSKHVMR